MRPANLLLGSFPAALIAQFCLFAGLSLYVLRKLILQRIGSLEAIAVLSYPRVILCLLLCSLSCVVAHQTLLIVRPSESWWQCVKYLFYFLLSYPFVGIFVCGLGVVVDGGKALRVVTPRYKPDVAPGWLIDLTRDHGRNAQLIPRGSIGAYVLVAMLTILVSLGERFASR